MSKLDLDEEVTIKMTRREAAICCTALVLAELHPTFSEGANSAIEKLQVFSPIGVISRMLAETFE